MFFAYIVVDGFLMDNSYPSYHEASRALNYIQEQNTAPGVFWMITDKELSDEQQLYLCNIQALGR